MPLETSSSRTLATTWSARFRQIGNGTSGGSGDGGLATSAQLRGPVNVAVDATGDLFIADAGNYLVRKVSPDRKRNQRWVRRWRSRHQRPTKRSRERGGGCHWRPLHRGRWQLPGPQGFARSETEPAVGPAMAVSPPAPN